MATRKTKATEDDPAEDVPTADAPAADVPEWVVRVSGMDAAAIDAWREDGGTLIVERAEGKGSTRRVAQHLFTFDQRLAKEHGRT